jgi:C1A family cysteine protease
MITNRKFGWIKDIEDPRDKKLTFAVRKLPESVDLRPFCPSVYDQKNLGSCTANAIASAYEFEHMKQNLGAFMPSRLFIYYNERVMENSVNSDDGAMIRDGMKSIGTGEKGMGVCSENLWPYDVAKFTNKPTDVCYKEALSNQAIEYNHVKQTPLQLKACLADGFPFVFGFTVYSNFMDIGSDGIMPRPKGSIEGGHAVKAVGYLKIQGRGYYIIKNSWGIEWGAKGYFFMPEDYMHDSGLCDDFWTIRKVE